MTRVTGLVAGLALVLIAATAGGVQRDVLQEYQPVSSDRLRQPADGDWLMIRRTYDGWGYSPLASDHAGQRRAPAAGVDDRDRRDNGHEAPPIVNDGVMFVATPGNQVIALEAATGRRAAGATSARCPTASCCCTRRAAAWRCTTTRCSSPPTKRCSSRSTRATGKRSLDAPGRRQQQWLLHDDGAARRRRQGHGRRVGRRVRRSRLSSRRSTSTSGKELWRTYSVPAPGEPGSETWPKGDQWKTGGGPMWVTGNYDPETNLAFWGTGNGGPWMGDQRPGDNLYTASTLAIDVATGAIKGHFQYHPNDSWDWDEVSPPILVDYTRDGRTIKGLDRRRARRLPVVSRAHARTASNSSRARRS